MLSPTQLQHFTEQGYLVLPDFKPASEIQALISRTREILDDTPTSDISGVFNAKDAAQDTERGEDSWFLDSDNSVRCFFEEEALDAQGQLNRPVAQAINKIGHALHDLDPAFEAFSHGPQLAELAADLGLTQPQVWQSMLICKQPGIGGEVRWHQDASYLYCDQGAVIGFWFALEAADLDNGCLWVQPGGHRSPLRERFFREGRHTWLEKLDATPWPDKTRAVPLPCAAGSLVVFHGLLPHASEANRSGRSRLAYTLHATDAGARYASSNWIQRGPALPVRGFAV